MKRKIGIYTASTLKHSYALKAQARSVHSACVYANIKDPTIVIVSSDEDFFDEVKEEYDNLFPEGKVISIKRKDFFDCDSRKSYKNEVQLMIAQMRTLGTKALLTEGCDRILSLDSDVLPHYNSIQCMLDILEFDKGYYSIAQCPYPSQGGGAFLGGRGTPERHILEDFTEEEKLIPKEILKEKKEAEKDLKEFMQRLAKDKVERNPKTDKEIAKKQQKLKEIDDEIKKCPPKANVFTLNGKKWRKRGWFDYAYPAIGKGSIVPVDWVGFGCTMMNKEAAALCDFSGYDGSGTEDLFIVWNRWYPNNLNIANISHCPSDHIVRDRGNDSKYIHIMSYHEKEGESIGHLRQKNLPWYAQDLGEKYDPENNGRHSEILNEDESL
jgi:hypothetical protein